MFASIKSTLPSAYDPQAGDVFAFRSGAEETRGTLALLGGRVVVAAIMTPAFSHSNGQPQVLCYRNGIEHVVSLPGFVALLASVKAHPLERIHLTLPGPDQPAPEYHAQSER